MKSLKSAVALLAVASGIVTGSSPASAEEGVCAGVARCHVVGRADVNGDGKRDVVGIANRGANGGAKRSSVVRVQLASGRIVTARREAPYFYGPLWQGAAGLDGRRGSELVVGHTSGAHTQFFHVLTWRSGRLVTLRAPRGYDTWAVDGTATVALGWQRTKQDPRGLIRLRTASLDAGDRWDATVTTYRWVDGRWRQRAKRTVADATTDTVSGWGGWRVPGLDRW